jgi:uroporphyrinogen-III synthase
VSAWRLLLTRPREEVAALAGELARAGVFSSSLPLLAIEPLAIDAGQRRMLADLARYQAVIVVSKPAARLAMGLLAESTGLPTPGPAWFSVGAATAAVLGQAGVMAEAPDSGDDSEALLAVPALQRAIEAPGARVLIVRGEGGREVLADTLRARGASVDYLQLYRRRLPAYASGTLARRVRAERLNALVVSSGQGFEHLRQLAGAEWPELSCLTLFVPSPRVAEMARAAGAQHVLDCRGASAAALLAALREHPAPVLQAPSAEVEVAPLHRIAT